MLFFSSECIKILVTARLSLVQMGSLQPESPQRGLNELEEDTRKGEWG